MAYSEKAEVLKLVESLAISIVRKPLGTQVLWHKILKKKSFSKCVVISVVCNKVNHSCAKRKIDLKQQVFEPGADGLTRII
jgi:hypothetical protein